MCCQAHLWIVFLNVREYWRKVNVENLKKNAVFNGMTEMEVNQCISLSGARQYQTDKEYLIFHQQDTPSFLYVLLSGGVYVCRDSVDGRRYIISKIHS